MPNVMPRILITGARKGIGRHLVTHYLERGFQVIGCSRTSSDVSADHYAHFELDVADEKAVKAMFRAVKHRWGGLEAVVNNAGIASMNHSLLVPAHTVRSILDTNVLGTFLFCRESAKLMIKKATCGRIVNLSTVAVPLHLEGEAIYAASKAAVLTLTQVLAKEFAPFGITINAVGPCPIKTDLIQAVPEDKLQALLARQAIHKYGELRDVSNIIDFFIHPDSRMVTGQVLYLGGV